MTPDELRALADRLDRLSKSLDMLACEDVLQAADYLLACADAKPVVWVDRLTDPQPHAVTDLAYRSANDAANGVEYAALFTHPAPAAPKEK